MPTDALVARLRKLIELTAEEVSALRNLVVARHRYKRGELIADLGEKPDGFLVVSEGLVARCKSCYPESREIIGFHVSGDFCNLDIAEGRPLDFCLLSMADTWIDSISRTEFHRIEQVGRLSQAFDQLAQVDAAIGRAWIANVLARRSSERLGHLMCELHMRLESSRPQRFPFGLTQKDLADSLGMSVVHLNRSMAELRKKNLLAKRGRLDLADLAGLARHSGFNPSYLR